MTNWYAYYFAYSFKNKYFMISRITLILMVPRYCRMRVHGCTAFFLVLLSITNALVHKIASHNIDFVCATNDIVVLNFCTSCMYTSHHPQIILFNYNITLHIFSNGI
jgi:hypothetical protein